jgi:iron(III) transport system ATP-binding protein
MNAIEVRDLALTWPTGFKLGPVAFALPAGAKTALVGPSGCGKTTLLRLLAGLEAPAAGTVRIGDRVVTGDGTMVPPGQRRIGFVFQDGALWPHLTAVQHLRFVDPKLSEQDATNLLDQVGLAHAADRKPAKLSGGEAQRLALARALAGRPDILLLDEPLHSVDVHLRDELSLLIRRIAQTRKLTLILVTHDREEALAVADHLIVLNAGRVVEQGPAGDMLRNPQTAFTASFLCRGACLPVEPAANGTVKTVFGKFPAPAHGGGRTMLVALPGDVCFTAAAAEGRPLGRVVQVVPSAAGDIATVELDGITLQVPCREPVVVGAKLALELCGQPRLLPEGDR